jgi:inner membrane protein
MVVSVAPDIDGIGLLFSEQAYFDWHHVAAHNLTFALLVSGVCTAVSPHRVKAFWIYLMLVHLHLLMDFLGSGPGWGIFYFWPFGRWMANNPYSWPFYSWENFCFAGIFLAWVVAIAIYDGRTPLEAVMPELDRKMVRAVRRAAVWRR